MGSGNDQDTGVGRLTPARQAELQGRVNAGEQLTGTDALEFNQFATPGRIEIGLENPEIAAELSIQRQDRDQFRELSAQFLDPARAAQRANLAQQRGLTSTINQLSGLGLAGSNVGIGLAQQQGRAARSGVEDRQFQDQLRALQASAILNQDIRQTIFGAQDQFGRFQESIIGFEEEGTGRSQKETNVRAVGGTIGAIVGGFFGSSSQGSQDTSRDLGNITAATEGKGSQRDAQGNVIQ